MSLETVHCHYCGGSHEVSSYQSAAFGHSTYCAKTAITVSVAETWNGGKRTFRMKRNYMGERIDSCKCTKCGGTGRQALPKRMQARRKR